MELPQHFVVFWENYPRKIGKLAAVKAYARALKTGVTPQQILDGVLRYIEHKPAYADWAHPSTWLNQGRWDDEYERRSGSERRQTPRDTDDRRLYPDWWEECKQLHNGACNGQGGHRVQMNLDRMRRGEVV